MIGLLSVLGADGRGVWLDIPFLEGFHDGYTIFVMDTESGQGLLRNVQLGS